MLLPASTSEICVKNVVFRKKKNKTKHQLFLLNKMRMKDRMGFSRASSSSFLSFEELLVEILLLATTDKKTLYVSYRTVQS